MNNFGERWDIGRLIWLVEALDPKDPFPHRKEVVPELSKIRELRNETAHQDYCTPGKLGSDDDQLNLMIEFAKTYLPRINGLNKRSPKAIKIRTKLEELQLCLNYGESDVQTIVNME